jgi:hypothetical protein
MSGKIIEIGCKSSFFDSIAAVAETHSAMGALLAARH